MAASQSRDTLSATVILIKLEPLKKLLLTSILFVSTVACSETRTVETSKKNIESQTFHEKHNDNPKVDVIISVNDSLISIASEVYLNIKLRNQTSSKQRLLFDKPPLSTGGPWGTSASVINTGTKETAVKHENKAVLSSQLYFEEQLKDSYYSLEPEQEINRDYKLTDLVIYKNGTPTLDTGTYELQVFYFHNPSNKVKFTVK